MALMLAAELGKRTLVIMNDRQLLEQWKANAQKFLGLKQRDIGQIGGGRKSYGKLITLALQQSLWSAVKKGTISEIADRFGAVIVDEVQRAAARTFEGAIHYFPARYRIGFSADETRKDRKEFLIYDSFGRHRMEIDRNVLEAKGFVLPVKVRLVPTDFRADWYRDAEGADRDFTRLISEMIHDEKRHLVLEDTILQAREEGPTFIFTHRVEHAQMLADVWAFQKHLQCGLLLGGAENAVRFAEDRQRLESGGIGMAVGTYQAIGTGIDFPAVSRGIVSTPIGNNAQFFGQVRGRMCRPGKEDAILYWLWDREVFPKAPKRISSWNDGRVELLRDGKWVKV